MIQIHHLTVRFDDGIEGRRATARPSLGIEGSRSTERPSIGIEALRDVSFRVHEGELVFVVGRSGSGKSTLCALITAELRASKGQIIVAGRNLTVLKPSQRPFLRRAIGRMWEEPRLLADRSVRDNVAIPLNIINVRNPRARVEQVLELVGMERHIDAMPRWLSGLEQQRVALARAIVHEPALLVADEPGGSLDPEGALAITQMLRDVRSRGTTVVITTRNRAAIEHFGDRIIVLNQGFLIEDSAGEPADLVAAGGRAQALDAGSAGGPFEVVP